MRAGKQAASHPHALDRPGTSCPVPLGYWSKPIGKECGPLFHLVSEPARHRRLYSRPSERA